MKPKAITYVLNVNGKPLMPTTRSGHVRRLLKSGAARVVKRNPFTIQLNYKTEDAVQDLTLGIDPGRTNIGLAVVDEKGECVFAAQVKTRNAEIKGNMTDRNNFRNARRHNGRRCKRQRRAKKNGTVIKEGFVKRVLPQTEKPVECKLIKNKEARFCNREREPGWLTPTANQLQQTHLNLVTKVEKILPIKMIALEVNKFSFMKLDDENIRPWEYQRGPLYGFTSRNDAVYALQNGRCLLCGKPRIDRYHHVIPKHEGGSDTISNIAGICEECHNLVHKEQEKKDELKLVHEGAKKKYAGVSVLNQILPQLIRSLSDSGRDLFLAPGFSTYSYRDENNLPKEHCVDAYCIAMVFNDGVARMNFMLENPYQIQQFRRHDRRVCNNAMIDRKYYLNGKVVATNRHKRMEQTSDSLEEFLKKNPHIRPEMLAVPQHKPTHRNMDRIRPGTLMRCGKDVFIYNTGESVKNGVPFYAKDTNGLRHIFRKSTLMANNAGLVFSERSVSTF